MPPLARCLPLLACAATLVILEPDGEAQLYKEAPPAVNKRAERQLRRLFNGELQQPPMSDVVICGPFLWRQVAGAPALKDVKGMESIFVTPAASSTGGLTLHGGSSGRTFNNPANARAFGRALAAKFLPDRAARIRKLRLSEARLFLQMLPFPAEEPLFVVETRGHRLIVHLDASMRIAIIDDYLHLK